MRKCENETIFLPVEYRDLISASVESAATVVCMLVFKDIMTPFRRQQLDCIDLLVGRTFPNDESEK